MSSAAQFHVELDSGERRGIPVPHGQRTLADTLAAQGLPLNTRCGQRGLCRGCEVELREGSLLMEGGEVSAPATVQACRARPGGAVLIHIPQRSRIEHRPQVGETFEIAVTYAHHPLFPPTPGGRDTAFAVDIGTTTVVVLLVDLVTGEVLSRAGAFNEQIRFGDNVITRIEAACQPEMLGGPATGGRARNDSTSAVARVWAGRAFGRTNRRWRDGRKHHHAAPARGRRPHAAGHRALHAALHYRPASFGR